MNNINNFIYEYRFIIILVLAIAIYSLFEWQRVKSIAYSLMLQAKSLAKDAVLNSGSQQEKWVVEKAYQFLPKSFTLFLSEERLKKLIHYLYVKAKDYLDDSKLNNSIE